MTERSKLDREITSNVAGQRLSAGDVASGDSDASSDFTAITLLVASLHKLLLKGSDTVNQLRESLQQLGAVGVDELIALEVIWQPEGVSEVLNTDALITTYPDLQHP